MVPTSGPNNDTPTGDQAAPDPTLFDVDPLQPGEICLGAFHALNLCSMEDQMNSPHGRKETRSTNKSK